MSRFLLVVPPFRGHAAPLIGVAEELERRGHTVAWVAHESELGTVLPAHAQCFAANEERTVEHEAAIEREMAGQRGFRSLRFFWEFAVAELARSMMNDVDRAIASFQPDVVISDQYCLAGAFGARRAGIPWATTATNTGFMDGALDATPKVSAWIHDLLVDLQAEVGLAPVDRPDLSPALVIVFSSRALLGGDAVDEPRFRYVGAVTTAVGESVAFPWDRLVEGPRVLVTLGTTAGERGRDFLRAAIEGVHRVGAQAIAVSDPLDGETRVPTDAIVMSEIPQLEVLDVVDAVICHGGHNTICEALLRGRPLMVAPLSYDQPANARLVQRCGAGLVVPARRSNAQTVADGLTHLLADPAFRQAARRVGDDLREGGGAVAATDALEGLVAA